jgi:hypothetical protein
MRVWGFWLSVIAALVVCGTSAQGRGAHGPPPRLRDTGLYSNWASKTVNPKNLPFSPQYPLWSDGASKRRWIRIPPGTFIDAADPDCWIFPVGTRLWKEFSFGHAVETRYMERLRSGEWLFATYVWTDDHDAVLAPERGLTSTAEVGPGIRHIIPSTNDCRSCHEGKASVVLGFGALQLSSDRDPRAPHAEPRPEGGLDLSTLPARGVLRGLPKDLVKQPPRISGSATARAALGYLHANCGGCHNATGPLAELGLDLSYPVRPGAALASPPALRTMVDQPARFNLPGADGTPALRVSPGRSDASLLSLRMDSRHPVMQMPPLGTRIVDQAALALIKRWISNDIPSNATNTSKDRTP